MSQQINLYNPALRRRRELLSANYLAIALVVVLAGVVGGAVYGRQLADRAEARTRAVEAELQADQARLTAAAKAAAEHKPDPALVRDLAQAKDLAGDVGKSRAEKVEELKQRAAIMKERVQDIALSVRNRFKEEASGKTGKKVEKEIQALLDTSVLVAGHLFLRL